jgi:3-hydroxybutyryl-CoA dehydrogenase
MGAGIAFLAARSGYPVILVDALPAALERAALRLERDAQRAGAAELPARITYARSIAELAATSIVIEAVPEELDLKRDVFAQLERAVGADTVIATNTSALGVAEIGARLQRPDRFLGLHFFNPPAAMPLVEIVRAPWTGESVLARARAFVATLERTGIVVADTAGFIVNRIARPFYLQALRARELGVADAATLDALARGAGFPMGPFALMDLIGLDVNGAVSRAVYERLGAERLRPHPAQARLIDAGLFGRKTGRGFFSYAPGAVAPPVATIAFAARGAAGPLTVLDPDGVLEPLVVRAEQNGAAVRRAATVDALPDDAAPVVYDAYRFRASELRGSGRPVLGIGVLGPLDDQSAIEVIDDPGRAAAADVLAPLFAGSSIAALAIADVPGRFVGASVASIVNEALYARADGVAIEADIDRALQLGVRYPRGPFAWLERIGRPRVAAMLEQLAAGDPAFAPHPALFEGTLTR